MVKKRSLLQVLGAFGISGRNELEAGRRLEMQTWNRCYSSHSGKLTNLRMQVPPRGMCLLTFVEFSGDGRKFIDCVDFCVASAKICRRSTFLREDDD